MLGLYEVFYAAYLFLRLISAAILIYCVLSWFRPTFRAFDLLRAFSSRSSRRSRSCR